MFLFAGTRANLESLHMVAKLKSGCLTPKCKKTGRLIFEIISTSYVGQVFDIMRIEETTKLQKIPPSISLLSLSIH